MSTRRFAAARALLGLSGASLALAACSSAPPPPPVKPVATAKPVEPAPPPPARWVRHLGGSMPGVRTPKGTLVLLGGKRALVADDGTITAVKADDEPIDALEVVPVPGGSPVVIGTSLAAVYRFDDPVGPGKRIASLSRVIMGVHTYPGRIGLRTTTGTLWLDVDGKSASAPPLALQATKLSFADDKRGIAAFPAAGNAVTNDGGATWTLLDRAPSSDLDGRDGVLRLGEQEVDAATGKLSPRTERREPTLVRWLRKVGLSPLEVAVKHGLELAPGRALAGGHDVLLEVDLATGLPVAEHSLAAHLPKDTTVHTWGLARTPREGRKVAYLMPLSYDVSQDAPPVLEVNLSGPKPAVRKLRDRKAAFDGPFASSTGGLGWMGPCESEDESSDPNEMGTPHCVRQPDGSFRTIWATIESPGATEEGGLVGLAMSESEDSPNAYTLELVDKAGQKKNLGLLRGTVGSYGFMPDGRIDEAGPGEYAQTVTLPIGDGEPVVSMLRFAQGAEEASTLEARYTDTRAYSLGRVAVATEGGLKLSTDAGKTWSTVPMPKPLAPDFREELAVSEVGVAYGPFFRVGWGLRTEGEVPGYEERDFPSTVELPKPGKGFKVTCTVGKDTKSATFLSERGALTTSLEQKPTKGLTSTRAIYPDGLRTHALLDVRHPDASSKSKPELHLSWIDHTEQGARLRSSKGPVHPDFVAGKSMGTMRLAVAAGDRAVFFVERSGKVYAGRASAGAVEIALYPGKRAPRDAAIARDGTVSFVGDDGVGHWAPKGQPRLIAKVRPAQLAVAAPTKDGVPVLVGEKGWSAFRVVPVPKDDSAPWLDVGGWKAAPLAPAELDKLEVCGAKAPAHRFVLQATTLPVELPGDVKTRSSSVFARTDGATACVEGFVARLGKGPGDSFARADLAKKKAEGGPIGKAPQTLTCATN
jgi:hypothetical protein